MKNINLSIDSFKSFFDHSADIKKQAVLLAAGLFSTLSFAPFYFFPAFMITLPLLLFAAMTSARPREAFRYGCIFGFGHFFAGLYWIGNSFAVEQSIPDWAGYIMVAVLAVFLALFVGFVAWGVKYIHKDHSLKTHLLNIVISFSVLWSVAEWLRGVVFTGFPWNLTGYIWGFSDIMLQSTAIWGIYGLSIITVLLAFTPLLMLDRKCRIAAPVLGMFVIVGLFFYGKNRLSEDTAFIDGVNLRIVQANIKQQDKWPYQNWSKNLVTHMAMSEDEDAQKSGTTHVIWPETAVIYSLSEEPLRRQLVSQILGEGGTVLTGFPRRQRDEDGTKIFNSLIAIDDQGGIAGIYDKSHLVPFGEYLPSFIKSIFISLGFDKLFTGGQDFSEGQGPKTLSIDGLPPVGVLICYEVIFPGKVTDPENRPDWLLNITNDAWYGDSSGPRQHLLQTRVRAIEEGLPIVRSASTGISALIDPYGRVLNEIALNRKGVINNKLPEKIATDTIYSLYKEWIFVCINVILIIANIVLLYRFATLRR